MTVRRSVGIRSTARSRPGDRLGVYPSSLPRMGCLAVAVAVSCILSVAQTCSAKTDDGVGFGFSAHAAESSPGSVVGEGKASVRRWLDRHNYTADELLLYIEMPIIISGGWRRSMWWRTTAEHSARSGKGLALPELSVGDNVSVMALDRLVKYRRKDFETVCRKVGCRPRAPGV